MGMTTQNLPDRLRHRVKRLGEMIGLGVKLASPDGERIFSLVEQFRRQAEPSGLDQLVGEMRDLDAGTRMQLSRAYGGFADLSNAAEDSYRIESIRSKADPHGLGSLFESHGNDGALFDALLKLKVVLVFTAHPTESKDVGHRQLVCELASRLAGDGGDLDQDQNLRSMAQELLLLERMPDSSKNVSQEIAEVVSDFRNMIPAILKIAAVLRQKLLSLGESLGRTVPAQYRPIRLALWPGVDADGNDRVTPPFFAETVKSLRAGYSRLIWSGSNSSSRVMPIPTTACR